MATSPPEQRVQELHLEHQKAPSSGAFPVRPRGLEPPRTNQSTRPSTLRVYQFRHRRVAGQYIPVPWALLESVRRPR
jgi:hypothetical protein